MDRDPNDYYTIWAKRIKKKNKRLITEIGQVFFLLFFFGLFFTTCWGIDRFVNAKAVFEDGYTWP